MRDGLSIGVVTYETSFAPHGGIAPVVKRLGAALAAHPDVGRVVIVTPLHRFRPVADTELIARIELPLEGARVQVNLRTRTHDGALYVFVDPEDPRLFLGRTHPYDVPDGGLVRDAAFFGVAAAEALRILGPEEDWHVLINDWEGATAAVAMQQRGLGKTCLVVHNTYDVDATATLYADVGLEGPPAAATLLACGAHAAGGRVATVSKQFALDLSSEPLQAQVLGASVDFLHTERSVVGVDNGPFLGPETGQQAVDAWHAGGVGALMRWKRDRQQTALSALRDHVPSPGQPVWGSPEMFARGAVDAVRPVPWFVMGGRADPNQKGFDAFVQAIRRFLFAGGEGRFLFFPMPSDDGEAGLVDLRDLTWQRPDCVVALPFRWTKGYGSALAGAHYGVMPSLREPFGSAHEYTWNGTVAIARATGGLVQQVVPRCDLPSANEAVQTRARVWHAADAAPTGLLFREADGLPTVRDWRHIVEHRPATEREAARGQTATWQGLVNALTQALWDASRLLQERPSVYGEMVVEGVGHIRRSFSWERAADEYLSLLRRDA